MNRAKKNYNSHMTHHTSTSILQKKNFMHDCLVVFLVFKDKDLGAIASPTKSRLKRTSSFELTQSDVESIGSGRRASDTDTDSDSDFSSHEDDYFYNLPDCEHGDYDPSSAFEKVWE